VAKNAYVVHTSLFYVNMSVYCGLKFQYQPTNHPCLLTIYSLKHNDRAIYHSGCILVTTSLIGKCDVMLTSVPCPISKLDVDQMLYTDCLIRVFFIWCALYWSS